jgi:hypothetical protein
LRPYLLSQMPAIGYMPQELGLSTYELSHGAGVFPGRNIQPV